MFLMIGMSAIAWLPWQPAIYLAPYFIVITLAAGYVVVGSPGPALHIIKPMLLLLVIAFLSGMLGLWYGASMLHPLFWFITNGSFALAFVGAHISKNEGEWLLRFVLQLNIGIGCAEATRTYMR